MLDLNRRAVAAGLHDAPIHSGDPTLGGAGLPRAAEPGRWVRGALTVPDLAGAVSVEPLGTLELKGKAAPVAAFRLLELSA